MSQLPEIGSKHIHRETLTPVEYLWNGPMRDDDESSWYHAYAIQMCGMRLPIRPEDFHRDFIPDGPVTLERLEAIGWKRYAAGAVYQVCPPIQACLEWNIYANPFVLTTRDLVIPLRPPESLADVLHAMRVFGAGPVLEVR